MLAKKVCFAFSPTMLREVRAQDMFASKPLAMNRVRAAYQEHTKWDLGQEITVGFIGGTQQQRQFFVDIINDTLFNPSPQPHQCKLNLRMRWLIQGESPPNATLRVSFNPRLGAWSFLGKENLSAVRPGEATMNLGWMDEPTGGVCIHEALHAMSLIHEHQSPNSAINWNKEVVYRLFGAPPNSWDRKTVDTNVFGTVSMASTNSSEYDPRSIMHYVFPCAAFTGCKPNAPGLDCTCDANQLAQVGLPANCCQAGKVAMPAQQLSPIDVKTLQQMYPLVFNPSPPVEGGEEPPGTLPVGQCGTWSPEFIAVFTIMWVVFLALVAVVLVWVLRRKR